VPTPLGIGTRAPDFTLKDQNNQEVRLSDFQGRKAVLLVFYPLTFTGTCQGELTEVKENLSAYANSEVQVLAVSVDSSYSHKVWAAQEEYFFPLLADFWPHGQVAKEFGVFNEIAGFANRGTFVIDKNGTIVFSEMLGPGESRDQEKWRAALAGLRA
jgi:mycoredoxin-dependent peroxiredoxin